MKVESNYKGNWDDICQYCGRLQREHQNAPVEHEDIRYIHRMPCEEEQYAIKKRAVIEGFVTRTIVWVFNVLTYIWSKVPFKKEFSLLFQLAKNIYMSIRAIVYLRNQKPKE